MSARNELRPPRDPQLPPWWVDPLAILIAAMTLLWLAREFFIRGVKP